MKSKYMSRKFIVAVCGIGLALVALIVGNNGIAYAGITLAGSFVMGESIVDAMASTKRHITVDESTYKNVNVSRETLEREVDGSKNEAQGNWYFTS